MRNQNCETIEAMMQKIKIQTGENEARPDKVIRSMADEMADSILEDADENAARQFFYIFSRMDEEGYVGAYFGNGVCNFTTF